MVFIAIPFSFLMGNRGALFGIGIAVGISMVYWGTLGIFSSLGATAVLSPLLSAFAPLVLFSSAISFSCSCYIKTLEGRRSAGHDPAGGMAFPNGRECDRIRAS